MNADNIDLIKFGELIQAVSTLTKAVEKLELKVEALNEHMGVSKGIAAGILITAGGIGAGASELLRRFIS